MDGAVWKEILERYGQSVILRRQDGERAVKAFFQPVREKAAGEEPTPLGVTPRGKYLYLGPAGEALEDVEELVWKGREFRVLRRREFPVGDAAAYQWGLLEEMDA